MDMIIIALGSNLPFPPHQTPVAVCTAALAILEDRGVYTIRRSSFYTSAPVPISDQPWYANAVVAVETSLSPSELLSCLLQVERSFGRERRGRNTARTLDLDLIAYGGMIALGPQPPLLPHPRMHDRAFVILPLQEIAPEWRHPVSGATIADLARALPDQAIQRLES